MSLHTERCGTCRGTRTLDYYEEFVDGEWRRRHADDTPTATLDALCVTEPTVIRVRPGPCFKCDGAGEYQVEYVACKIY